jgi:hypothetical protein
LDPKDDTQTPGGMTPLSGSAIADEPTQPIGPVRPVSKPKVGIPTYAPKIAPSVPSISQDEPLMGGVGSVMGSVASKATMPAADEPMVVNEPEETKEEPEISPIVEPEKTPTDDTGTGGVSGL